MSIQERIKQEVLAVINQDPEVERFIEHPDGTVEIVYKDGYRSVDAYNDYLYDFRNGQFETDIEPQFNPHYEARSVAHRCQDGQWIGWTYWYGGGKHGEPGTIDWMGGAYYLNCVEEEKVVTVRTFSKVQEGETKELEKAT